MRDRELERAAADIDRLRSFRVRPERDLSAAKPVEELRAKLQREITQTGGMGEAWRAAAPSDLAAKTRVASFQRGVLTIEAPDAGTRYLVEQWLRGGGRRVLSGCAPSTISRVNVRSTISPRPDPGAEPGKPRVGRGKR